MLPAVMSPTRFSRQRGQTLPIFALTFVLIVALASLVIDGGLSLGDKRALQAAADVASLAGAAATSIETGGAGQQCAVLQVSQSYAWQNLSIGHTPLAADCTGPNASGEYTWTEPASGYTVTATYPYVNQDSAHVQQDPNVSVHVVVDHVRRTAVAGALGTNSVTIHAASAAKAGAGKEAFPFALATRYLQVQGSGSADVYGAALIGNCDDGGVGDYTANSHSGGLWSTNGTNLNLGMVKDAAGNYTSAQALLLAKPPASCAPPANNAIDSVVYAPMAPSSVCFVVSNCTSEFNGVFGFNSGPSGCADATANPPTPACQAKAYGDGAWQDNACWLGGSGAANVVIVDKTFVEGTGLTGLGTATPCNAANPNGLPGAKSAGGGTREGSFADASMARFPSYPSPESLVTSFFTPSVGSTCPSACVLTPGTNPGNHVYTGIGGNQKTDFVLAPGWYVFDGSSASIQLNKGSVTCQGSLVPVTSVPGCVLIFRNGAVFDLTDSTLNCSPSAGPGTLPCAFDFPDTTVPTASYMSLTGGASNVSLAPIPYTQNGLTAKFPIFWSASRNNAISGTPNKGPAALNLAGNKGGFNVGGTIYANKGTVVIGQNANPAAGQTIADIISLQGGSTFSGVTSYAGGVIADIPGAAVLIE